MRVLVVGCGGTLENKFIKQNKKKYDIVTLNKNDDSTDIAVLEALFVDKIDKIVFFATSGEDKEQKGNAQELVLFKNVQYLGTLNRVDKMLLVTDGADLCNTRVLDNATESDFKEVLPQDGYGVNRYLMTSLALADKITTVLRLFCVYGDGFKPANSIVSKMIQESHKKQQVTIKQNREISLINVDDALMIIDSFLVKDIQKGSYNICPSTKTSIADIAKAIKKAGLANEETIKIIKTDKTANTYTASNEKLMEVLPKQKFISINKGIQGIY